METIIGDVLLSAAFLAYAGKSKMKKIFWRIIFLTGFFQRIFRSTNARCSLFKLVASFGTDGNFISARYGSSWIFVKSRRSFALAKKRIARRRFVHRKCHYVETFQSVPVDRRSVRASDRIHDERIEREENYENKVKNNFCNVLFEIFILRRFSAFWTTRFEKISKARFGSAIHCWFKTSNLTTRSWIRFWIEN